MPARADISPPPTLSSTLSHSEKPFGEQQPREPHSHGVGDDAGGVHVLAEAFVGGRVFADRIAEKIILLRVLADHVLQALVPRRDIAQQRDSRGEQRQDDHDHDYACGMHFLKMTQSMFLSFRHEDSTYLLLPAGGPGGYSLSGA